MFAKPAIVLIFVLFLVHNTSGQSTFMGMKFAYNQVSFVVDGSGTELNPRNTFNIACVGSFETGIKRLGFSMEPGYILKGSKVASTMHDYKLHYLNMPILLDVYPIPSLTLSAGPELGYLILAKNTMNGTAKTSILDTYDKQFELSGTIGATYALSYFLNAGLRYNMSLTNVSDSDTQIGRTNVKNQYLQFLLIFKVAN